MYNDGKHHITNGIIDNTYMYMYSALEADDPFSVDKKLYTTHNSHKVKFWKKKKTKMYFAIE